MDISGINSSSAISQLLTNQTSTSPGASGVPTDSNDMSAFAKLMSELQQLQQSDPDKFKSVMSDIAKTLKTDAQNATGSQATFLNNLSSKFDQAAQTGQMPDLQPKAQSAGGGHHHHHHVQSYQAQAASPADTSAATASSSSQQTQFSLAQVIQNALQNAGVTLST
jgi:HSP90 family molecular chaperone